MEIICTRELHSKLNPYQHEVVHLKEGQYLVSAAAGSGKSTTIVARIEQLIKDGVDPNKIGAFTFAKFAAGELQKRLKALDITTVNVSTLHALCYNIIREDGSHIGGNFQVDDKNLIFYQTKDFIQRTYKGSGLDPKVADSIFGLAKANCLSAHPINEGQDKLSIVELFKKHCEKPWLADAYYNLFSDIEAWKVSKHLLNYDDMLYLAWLLLADHEDIQAKWADKFEYFMIDEAQDSSTVQNAIARMVSKKSNNVMIVGDVLQCIPGTEVISTPSGLKQIQEIKIGEEIYACAAGLPVIDTVTSIGSSVHATKLKFTLEDNETFSVTKNHACFAALDNPNGYYVYLMHRKDLGYRIGISSTMGYNGDNLIIRTLQEGADRMWLCKWFDNKRDAAVLESSWSLEYGIPKEPFRERKGMWVDKIGAAELFGKFGNNGAKLLAALEYDFNLPNYIGKSKGDKFVVSLGIASKDRHQVIIESNNIPEEIQKKFGFIKSLRRDGSRIRKYFNILEEAETFAADLASALNGTVAKSLTGTGEHRRMLQVLGANLHENMLVPVKRDGVIVTRRVIKREELPCKELCYDLRVKNHGNFMVNNTIVHNSLYLWRGAAPSEFIGYSKQYKVYKLPVNYRSTTDICAAATRLTDNLPWNITGTTIPHEHATTDATSIVAKEYENPNDEAVGIAEQIIDLVQHGRKWKDVAILYRISALLQPIEDALVTRKIPYVVWSGYTFYDRKEIKDVLSYLYVISLRDNTEQHVKRAMNVPFRYVSKQYIECVEDVAKSNNYSFIDAMKSYRGPRENVNTTVRKFGDLLDHLHAMYSRNEKPRTILEAMLSETRYVRTVQQEEGEEGPDPDSGAKLTHIHQLLKIAEGFTTVDAFLEYVAKSQTLLAESRKRKGSDAVVLSTIHSVKGMEFDIVFAPGWNDGIIPHLKNPSQDEELRIAYVCLTRAAKQFRCSWNRTQITQGGLKQLPMSKFITMAGLPTVKLPVKKKVELNVMQWMKDHPEFIEKE